MPFPEHLVPVEPKDEYCCMDSGIKTSVAFPRQHRIEEMLMNKFPFLLPDCIARGEWVKFLPWIACKVLNETNTYFTMIFSVCSVVPLWIFRIYKPGAMPSRNIFLSSPWSSILYGTICPVTVMTFSESKLPRI